MNEAEGQLQGELAALQSEQAAAVQTQETALAAQTETHAAEVATLRESITALQSECESQKALTARLEAQARSVEVAVGVEAGAGAVVERLLKKHEADLQRVEAETKQLAAEQQGELEAELARLRKQHEELRGALVTAQVGRASAESSLVSTARTDQEDSELTAAQLQQTVDDAGKARPLATLATCQHALVRSG
jgi:chromosome segregation ATPase